MIKINSGRFHNIECATQYAHRQGLRALARKKAKADKEFNAETKQRKAAIKKRTGPTGYYANLRTELHKYVKHNLRKGEPCYTCGKPQHPTDNGGAFHVGHFVPAGTVDPRRFMLENLRIQCFSCNAMKSGQRVEYRLRMTDEMGLAHVEWLECDANHKELKLQYPDVKDIQAQAASYRTLNKPIK
jgi:hypothetical protein